MSVPACTLELMNTQSWYVDGLIWRGIPTPR